MNTCRLCGRPLLSHVYGDGKCEVTGRPSPDYSKMRAKIGSIYASGPFTYLDFFLQDGEVRIAVSRRHSAGFSGDLVNGLSSKQFPATLFNFL